MDKGLDTIQFHRHYFDQLFLQLCFSGLLVIVIASVIFRESVCGTESGHTVWTGHICQEKFLLAAGRTTTVLGLFTDTLEIERRDVVHGGCAMFMNQVGDRVTFRASGERFLPLHAAPPGVEIGDPPHYHESLI